MAARRGIVRYLVSDEGGREGCATFPLTKERRGHYKLLPLPVGSDSPSISRIWPSIERERERERERGKEGWRRRKSYWPLLIKIPFHPSRRKGDEKGEKSTREGGRERGSPGRVMREEQKEVGKEVPLAPSFPPSLCSPYPFFLSRVAAACSI